jgi:hypothetical protein
MSVNATTFQSALNAAAFWRPKFTVESAWTQHVPFAFWLVSVFRPKCLVELGTHRGMSYLAFCQAIQELRIGTKCFAVDHWKGDEHAGFYEDRIFHELKSVNEKNFSDFSRLLRSDFDEAALQFSSGSIDLLHIDGLHAYEAVKHDFETWFPKLANPAIVLLHDTCVVDRGFGVHIFWSELSGRYRSFNFEHGYGLGVVGVGQDFSNFPEVNSLFRAASDGPDTDFVRLAFSQLGGRLATESELIRYKSSPTIGLVRKLLDLKTVRRRSTRPKRNS